MPSFQLPSPFESACLPKLLQYILFNRHYLNTRHSNFSGKWWRETKNFRTQLQRLHGFLFFLKVFKWRKKSTFKYCCNAMRKILKHLKYAHTHKWDGGLLIFISAAMTMQAKECWLNNNSTKLDHGGIKLNQLKHNWKNGKPGEKKILH